MGALRWLTCEPVGAAALPNPVLTASGCAASGKELSQFFDLAELGGVVTKSIMLRARSGRATPRMAETPSGMLNSIGLQGPGSTRSWRTTCPGCTHRRAGGGVDRRRAHRRVRGAGQAALRPPGGT